MTPECLYVLFPYNKKREKLPKMKNNYVPLLILFLTIKPH